MSVNILLVKSPNKWRRLKRDSIPSKNLPGMPIEVHEMEIGEPMSCEKQLNENNAPMDQEQLEISHEQNITENKRHFPKLNFPITTEIFEMYQEQIEFQQTQIQFLYRFIDYQKSLIEEKDIEIKNLKEEFKGQTEKKNKIIIRCEHEINKIKNQVSSNFTLYLILNNLYCSFSV